MTEVFTRSDPWQEYCRKRVNELDPIWKSQLKTARISPKKLCMYPNLLNDMTSEQIAQMPAVPAWLQNPWQEYCRERLKDLDPIWKSKFKEGGVTPKKLCMYPELLNDLTSEDIAHMPALPAWLQHHPSSSMHKYTQNNKWEAQRAADLLARTVNNKEPCHTYKQQTRCAENARRCAWNPVKKTCSDIRRNDDFDTPEREAQTLRRNGKQTTYHRPAAR